MYMPNGGADTIFVVQNNQVVCQLPLVFQRGPIPNLFVGQDMTNFVKIDGITEPCEIYFGAAEALPVTMSDFSLE